MGAGADAARRMAAGFALPAPGEAHVWEIDLAGDTRTLRACAAVLSNEERARGERYHSAGDAARFVIAHGHMRCILGLYACVHPSLLTFARSPFGKPGLDGPVAARGIRFNMTDSYDVALVAVAREREIGVDIERIDARPDIEPLAARCFCPAERRLLDEAAEAERAAVFTALWARKEAYIKAHGEGMSLELRSIDVSRIPGVLGGRWRVDDIEARPGYRSALALEGGEGRTTRYTPAQSAGALFNQEH